ncbi:MAG: hypothetical protein JRH06_13065 [Deltaproteobacteria bacterium]|nr:hypothetical protein [Deltaproteobacteria bacterium]MBW2138472.1 hypothetical protein [Deltaproteobacteria bacterium]
MKTAKYTLCSFLVIALLFSGLPSLCPEDANRDMRVDLEDAILHVKDLAGTADDTPRAFASKIKRTLSTIYMLAGLKTVIKQAGDKRSTTTVPSLDLPYLISLINFPLPSFNPSQLAEKTFLYESFMSPPILPPP